MDESIRTLIQSQDILVLATSLNNIPHTSLMAYVPSADSMTFFMATYRNTSKFANIISNPQVSLLLDDRNAHPSRDRLKTMALTIHGEAVVLQDPVQCKAVADALRQKHSHLQNFLEGKEIAFLAVQAATFQLLKGPTSTIFETTDHSTESHAV
ncbi:Pyridoxamine 5'-phosphate oxidase [Desulfonatronum thiosulfatophilum]|uniref:Pyridoxamine 5'-phosphate oxidase n=1 Tax=Desulfonatronum thiosulfatophilum TaxID=617002 RepID=A0A1G6A4A9_9BACT|nr:pyridoxamine 5'-phosphate oxidase family protein [Desulfonatronum thiosulfatophilum]SDB03277.1 Pyridoxamine 5'-phosphate oxidase [Desulfonatronum thiosulfatophilum]